MKLKSILAATALAATASTSAATPAETLSQLPDSVYLMAYFTSPAQHLFYAWSTDGLNWQQANGGEPVFTAYDDTVWMRDPYLSRVTRDGKDTYHLVHTWGWDNPAIFHWQSDDLINWTAADGGTTTDSGKIFVMDGKDGRPQSPNAWAPEYTYVPKKTSSTSTGRHASTTASSTMSPPHATGLHSPHRARSSTPDLQPSTSP